MKLDDTDSRAVKARTSWFSKLLIWLIAVTGFLCRVLLLAWATLAIYYSNLPWAWLRVVLALLFVAFGIWALWLTRRPLMKWVFAGVFIGVVVAWSTIQPSHDRPWRPEVAVMPRVAIEGDRVRITGVRNFDYRTRNDFTVHYEEREVLLSHLIHVDFYVSYWAPGLVAHTFVSFIFDNAPPLSISIETRPEVGEDFAPIASLFKQFELIYVVGDERDLVRLRTNYRDEEVYLYRLNVSAESARRLLMVYLKRINDLADRAEFYHLLSNSCTINIVRYANAAGRVGRFNIRHLFNGLIDGYLYNSGRIDTTLPFDELRRRSQINEAARAADRAPDFSQRIRASVPTIHPDAGSLGALAEKYDLTVQIAQDLIDKLENQGRETQIIASGTSCRHQISDLTNIQPNTWPRYPPKPCCSGSRFDRKTHRRCLRY